MKINWGTSLFIVIILFVVGLGSLAYISFQSKINLVDKDYYPLELDYQTMINKKNNSALLANKPTVIYSDGGVYITFPADYMFSEITGEIHFYRSSDYEKDIIVPIDLSDNGMQSYSAANFLKGNYIVKLDWQYADVDYFQEFDIYIN